MLAPLMLASLMLASCGASTEPLTVEVEGGRAGGRNAAARPSVSAPPRADVPARASWRPMSEEERSSRYLMAASRFFVDGRQAAVWLVTGSDTNGGELWRRPLDGGPTEVIATSQPVHDLRALNRGTAVVDLGGGYPWEQWFVPLDGASPTRVARPGQLHAGLGDELWAADEDGIWQVGAGNVPRFFHRSTVTLQVDAEAIYRMDVPGNLERIDRRTGSTRTLATGALRDLAFDGDSILWTRPTEERPGFTSQRRMILRTPRSGGTATHLTTGERVCGLWPLRAHVYFFGEDARAEVGLYRVPRRRATTAASAVPEPELVAAAPWVNTSFDCTEGAKIVGTSLVWGSNYGRLLRADLARSPVVIEVLDPERPVVDR